MILNVIQLLVLLVIMYLEWKTYMGLNNVISNQQKLFTMSEKLSAQMDLLTDKVAAEGSILNSLVTLLKGINDLYKDALNGENVSPEAQAKIDAINKSVDDQKQQIADAILANTTTPAGNGTDVNTGTDTTGGGVDTGNLGTSNETAVDKDLHNL